MTAGEKIGKLGRQVTTAVRAGVAVAFKKVVEPEFVEELREDAPWLGQWIAAFLLIVIVPLTFRFTVIFHRLIVSLALHGFFKDAAAAPFLVTLATLAFFVIGCWMWFQFPRTAGFGLFRPFRLELRGTP